MTYDWLYKVLAGVVISVIWNQIVNHFKIQKVERDNNGLGKKAGVIDAKILNDRMVDIACTKEFEIRMWKCEMFKEELKR